ncbi:MAG: sulfurtransferase [Acidobacteria bacterium]|nr:sulfurtransferase [Acidobacteriota bacterium]
MYSTLISSDTLAPHLDGSWVIVDCRYDLRDDRWGREQYRSAHIQGAVYASLSHDLAGPVGSATGRHPLPSSAAMEATFGRLGIGAGAHVVMYDQDAGPYASRMWWMLRYMGHDGAAVLDGGWAKWLREGRPVRKGEETRKAATFTGRPRKDLLLGIEDVEARLGDPSVLLVDARGPERFEGKTEPLDRTPGHIPGAVNHFYKRNVTDEGVMLPPDKLRRQFAEMLGERSPDRVVMYCGSGVSACQNLLAMEHAGLSGAKLYPGSWSEWSSDPARPVETGPAASLNLKVKSK